MEEGSFLKTLAELRILDPEEYRVKISSIFRDFIRSRLEEVLGFALPPGEGFMEGLAFRHKADIILDPYLYVESKIIATPDRVEPDHDKRIYQVSLASVDLKLKGRTHMAWEEVRKLKPHVSFAFAIPVETPERYLKHVEEHMVSLLNHYLDSCVLYVFDCDRMSRRDDLLRHKSITLDEYVKTISEKMERPPTLQLKL